MNSPNRDRTRTQFQAQGSLPKPGPIGRLVRLGWGVFLVFGFVNLAVNLQALIRLQTLPHWSFLAIALFTAFRVFPYVVTIGLGLNAPYYPLAYSLIALNVLGVGLSWLITGQLWSPPMGWFVGIWFLYTIGHLGISFLFSAVLATPGCEMRSLPHLWSLVTNRASSEHFCPGHIGAVDRWEMQFRKHR